MSQKSGPTRYKSVQVVDPVLSDSAPVGPCHQHAPHYPGCRWGWISTAVCLKWLMHATVLCYTVLRIFGALLLVIGPCSDVGALMASWPVSKPLSVVPGETSHTCLTISLISQMVWWQCWTIGCGDWRQRFGWGIDNLLFFFLSLIYSLAFFLKSARLF